MKTFHIGGFNPIRQYKTLDAALMQVKDDDTIELHKNITFAGTIKKNIIINGNGHTIHVKNGTIGMNCEEHVVLQNLTLVSEPRSNAVVFHKGGRLEQVTAKITGPARVLYPTIIHKAKSLYMYQCDLMRFISEEGSIVTGDGCQFRDYYGAVAHLSSFDNLSMFAGKTTLQDCTLECCEFKGTTTIKNSRIRAFNRSSQTVMLIHCSLEPVENKPAVNLSKEPKDGPLQSINKDTHFAWEQESGTVTVYDYESQIPEPFVGFHVLAGALDITDTKNLDADGYHIIRNASLSFTDTEDMSFYDITNGTLASVRSKVNTSIRTKTAMEELQGLIGLDQVKRKVVSILNNVKMKKAGTKKNLGFSYHMIFAGDPGTGKTTVAKIVAKALFEIGAVPENKCTEVSVDRLVKGYVGQTAEHVRKILDEALGGVLFIDEAYELAVKDNQNSFNSEALSVLIRYMEEHRDDLVVIAAGYGKEMKQFLASNVGLTRRFQWVTFEDYTSDEMSKIFESMRVSYEEDYQQQALANILPQLFEKLTMIYKRKPDIHGRITNGGNGGLVRNVFQNVITMRNNRVIETTGQTSAITKEDLLGGFRMEMEKAIHV